MLGLDLQVSDPPVPLASTEYIHWSGCIALSGQWRGAVTVSYPEPLARLATSAMFAMEAAEVTDAEIQDATGEIANLIGGQTKQVLGDACFLGLPVVIKGDHFEATVPHSHTVVTLHFCCENHPVDVAIVGADS